jgi:cytochrome c553
VAAALVGPATLRADTIAQRAQICMACHGENGVPPDKVTPVIAGQHQGYLYLQLRDYKRGTRVNERMKAVVEQLERDDMLAIAEYFSQQQWPDLRQPRASEEVTLRALRANASIGCTGCHLAEYQGNGTQPRLAGQSREYLARTMLEFRSRERGNNPGMSDLMKVASQEDLIAMAEYLAGR